MTIRRRFRRNSLKDLFESFYNETRRFSKEFKIHQQFKPNNEENSKLILLTT